MAGTSGPEMIPVRARTGSRHVHDSLGSRVRCRATCVDLVQDVAVSAGLARDVFRFRWSGDPEERRVHGRHHPRARTVRAVPRDGGLASDQGKYWLGLTASNPRRTSKCRKDGSPGPTSATVWPWLTLSPRDTVMLRILA